jgi:hypothetical protein
MGEGVGGEYEMVQEVRLSEEKSGGGKEKATSSMHQWDATSLITSAKFQFEGRLILDYALDVAQIVITRCATWKE